MRRISILLLITSIAACSKPTEPERMCIERAYKISTGLGFVGFSKADVDTIIVKHYLKGGGFLQLVKTDYVVVPPDSIVLQHDTLVPIAPRWAITGVDDAADYEISLPAIPTAIYRLSQITFGGDTVRTYSAKYGCKTHGFNCAAQHVTINGRQENTAPVIGPARAVYLKR